MQLLLNLGLSSVMVAATVLIHLWGLLLLIRVVSGGGAHLDAHKSRARAAVVILAAVFGVFAMHTVEIWLYAALYVALGETANFEQALYFSTTTFSSLGLGDVVLNPRWRMLSAIEGANGVILFAWSTAFLMTMTRRLRMLEHEWFDRHA
ncbi:MAG: two pore domain potassium channel family protein [Proteobacteria bacterium]|nr:two pore domain potassium channel family protein [Pseudomonadota bacterium]